MFSPRYFPCLIPSFESNPTVGFTGSLGVLSLAFVIDLHVCEGKAAGQGTDDRRPGHTAHGHFSQNKQSVDNGLTGDPEIRPE